jgi:predicted  nucleic acid-binding Zn-ribbon protein
MGLFSKKEKKLILSLGENNVQLWKEAVKELEELHGDVQTAYEDLDTLTDDFQEFIQTIHHKLSPAEQTKITAFAKKLGKADKCARTAVRDVRDVLRNTRKKLKEVQRELI